MLFFLLASVATQARAPHYTQRKPATRIVAQNAHLTFLQRLESSDLTALDGRPVVYHVDKDRIEVSWKSTSGKEEGSVYTRNGEIWTDSQCYPKTATCTAIFSDNYMDKTAITNDANYLFPKVTDHRFFDKEGNVGTIHVMHSIRGDSHTIEYYYLLNKRSPSYKNNIARATEISASSSSNFNAYLADLKSEVVEKGRVIQQRAQQQARQQQLAQAEALRLAREEEDEEDERRQARNSARQAETMAAQQVMMQSLGQLAARITGGRSAGPRTVPSYSPPVSSYSAPGYRPSGNDSNFPSASPGSVAATVFGPLPSDMGTPAERQFWAARCQNIPNDGGSAAQGCSQTLSSMGVSPSSLPAPVSSGRNTGGMAYSPEPGTRQAPAQRNGVVTSPPTAPRPAAAAYADMACFTVGYRIGENVGNGNYPKYVYVSSVFSSSYRNSAEAKFNDYVRTRYGRNSQGSPILNLYKSTCSRNDPQNVAVEGETSAQRDGGTTSVKVIHTYWQPQ